jgi:branched-chain amino acid transport system substrate-binding protein
VYDGRTAFEFIVKKGGREMRSIVIMLCVILLLVPALAFGADEIKVGFHVPLTGWAAADGQSSLRGAQLAVKFINAAGGINGKKINLVYYDDRCEAKDAVVVARKLIESDKCVGVVSGSYSTPTRAAAPIYNQSKVPYISTIGTHPEIPIDRKYVVQVAVMSEIHGKVGAKMASDKLKAKTADLLIMDNDFGTAVTDGFRKKAPTFGIKILNEYKYPLGEKDFRSLLSNIKNDNPDVLWASGYYEEAAQIAKQAKEMGVKATIIGQEGYDSPYLFKLGGDAVNGVVITTSLDRGSARPATKNFLTEYLKDYKVPGDQVAAQAFDGVNVIAYGLKKGGSDPDKIVDAISQIKNFEDAATGPIMYFAQNRVAIRPIVVQIVKNQAFTSFYTTTDKDLILP